MRRMTSAGLTRRTAIVSMAALVVAAGSPGRPVRRVLFVCQKGTVKSAIARELLRDEARARGIGLSVQSRGIVPEQGATPETAAALVRDGIDVRSDRLRGLTMRDCRWADVIVYFDPLPFAPARKDLRDWRDTPSVNQNYAAALAAMRSRIGAFAEELARKA